MPSRCPVAQLAVAGGTLDLAGSVTLAGQVTGAGALVLSNGSASVDAAALAVGSFAISYESVAITSGGTYAGVFDALYSTVDLGATTLDLAGQSTIDGTLTASGGALAVTGTAYLTQAYLTGGIALLDSGVIVQDGYLSSGPAAPTRRRSRSPAAQPTTS